MDHGGEWCVWLIGEIGYISILKVQNRPGFIRIHKIYYRTKNRKGRNYIRYMLLYILIS